MPVVFDASTFLGLHEFDYDVSPFELLRKLLRKFFPLPEGNKLFFRWVRRQLNARYALRQSEAQSLIDNGQIEYFIDGLSELGDDMAEEPGESDGKVTGEPAVSGKRRWQPFINALETVTQKISAFLGITDPSEDRVTLSRQRRQVFLAALEEVIQDIAVCLCVTDSPNQADKSVAVPGLSAFVARHDFLTLKLQELPDQVVAASLVGDQFNALRFAVVTNGDLGKEARNPFFLDYFRTAYNDDTYADQLLKKPISEIKARAIELTFEARWPLGGEFPPKLARRHLSNLARIVRNKSKTFLTDLAQPTWLDNSQSEQTGLSAGKTAEGVRAYQFWTCVATSAFVFFVLLIAVGGGQWWEWATTGHDHQLPKDIAAKLHCTLDFAYFLLGAATGLASASVAAIVLFFGIRIARKPWQAGVAFAIATGLARGIMLGMSVPVGGRPEPLPRGVIGAFGTFVACVLPLVWVFRLRTHTLNTVVPLANAHWNWRKAIIYSVATFAITAPFLWYLNIQSVFGLAPAFALILAFIFGYSGTFTNTESLVPNYGIHQSIRTALIFFIGSFFILPPLVGFGYCLGTLLEYHVDLKSLLTPSFSQVWAAIPGEVKERAWENFVTNWLLSLSFPVCTVVFGGLPVIQHYILRWVLDSAGLLPFRLPAFCEEAARHRILRQVGTGFQFDHKEMREHLAKH